MGDGENYLAGQRRIGVDQARIVRRGRTGLIPGPLVHAEMGTELEPLKRGDQTAVGITGIDLHIIIIALVKGKQRLQQVASLGGQLAKAETCFAVFLHIIGKNILGVCEFIIASQHGRIVKGRIDECFYIVVHQAQLRAG